MSELWPRYTWDNSRGYICARCHTEVGPSLTCNCLFPPTIRMSLLPNETIKEYLRRYDEMNILIQSKWDRHIRRLREIRQQLLQSEGKKEVIRG